MFTDPRDLPYYMNRVLSKPCSHCHHEFPDRIKAQWVGPIRWLAYTICPWCGAVNYPVKDGDL